MKIIPDILANNTEQYVSAMRIARQLTDRFHVDIIDGIYVDNKTIQPSDIQKQVDNKLDVHLMVADPIYYAKQSIALNPHTVIIQYETEGKVVEALDIIIKNGFRAGLSINPGTLVSDVEKIITQIDHLQIMGYEAGFSGPKLKKEVLVKAEQAKKIKPNIEVGLDGGVTDTNISAIAKAGFDSVDVNSYLFDNKELEPISAYSNLLEKNP